MVLKSLLVCADDNAAEILRSILEELDIEGERCCDFVSAAAKLSEARVDAIIVDCDDYKSATEVLKKARLSPLNGTSLVIALVHSHDDVRRVFAMGANFILYKPISVERARSSLRAARGLMRRERRRHPRIPVHTAAGIAYSNVESAGATLIDLSEEGTAIQSQCKLPASEKVYFQFTLPGHSSVVRLAGEVVWQDSSGRVGVRFVDVPQTSRKLLKEWLRQNAFREAKPVPRVPARIEPPAVSKGSDPVSKPADADDGLARFRATPGNRRGESRHACQLGAEVYQLGIPVPHRCSLSDISEGGCYVETSSPFPPETGVEILVRTRDLKIRTRGIVQSVHPGFGMGVRFKPKTAEERDDVQQLISLLHAQQALEPGLP